MKQRQARTFSPGFHRTRHVLEWVSWRRDEHTYQTETMDIVVHRHIDYPPDAWLVSVRPDIGISRKQLRATDAEAAKAEALETVRAYLAKLLKELT